MKLVVLPFRRHASARRIPPLSGRGRSPPKRRTWTVRDRSAPRSPNYLNAKISKKIWDKFWILKCSWSSAGRPESSSCFCPCEIKKYIFNCFSCQFTLLTVFFRQSRPPSSPTASWWGWRGSLEASRGSKSGPCRVRWRGGRGPWLLGPPTRYSHKYKWNIFFGKKHIGSRTDLFPHLAEATALL